jgi:hypothetical protein
VNVAACSYNVNPQPDVRSVRRFDWPQLWYVSILPGRLLVVQ